jgi:hypothetical protein
MADNENTNSEESNFEEDLINDYIDFAASVLGVDSLEEILEQLAHIRNVNLLKMSLDYRTAMAYEDVAEALREVAEAIKEKPALSLPPFPAPPITVGPVLLPDTEKDDAEEVEDTGEAEEKAESEPAPETETKTEAETEVKEK